MPNWCTTTYKCVGDPKEVRSLYDIIRSCEKTSRVTNGFGNLWLGNIVDALGEDCENVYCRGEITDYYIEETDSRVLCINQETAWREQNGFRHAIERKFPSIKVYFIDDEPGCDWFVTNDRERKFFSFPVTVEFCTEDDSYWEDFRSEKDALDYIRKEYGLDGKDAICAFNEENEGKDSYIYLHEYEFIDD